MLSNKRLAPLICSRSFLSLFIKQLILFLFLIPAGVSAKPVGDAAIETVTLQLKYLHQFQFAGYYAALEKGFYRDAGLDVKIKANGPGLKSPIDEILSGNAQYGIADISLVTERLAGKPVVVLANIFQKSPAVWIVREDSGISGLHDFVGKRVMHNLGATSELLVMLQVEGIPANRINLVATSFNIQDLIDGHVDAFNGYVTNEPYFLQEQGIPYRLISPLNYGIDSYGDVLFTSESEIENHPERAKAFRLASLKGWQYAMDHPDEIIDLIKTKYSSKKSRPHLKFEAKVMRDLILPDLVAIGHINPGRWQTIAEKLVALGSTKANYDLLEGFLYDPFPKHQDHKQLYVVIALVSLLALLFLALAIWIARLNIRLKESEKNLRENKKKLNTQFKAIPVPTYIWEKIDEDIVLVNYNDAAEEITHGGIANFVGKKAVELFPLMPEIQDELSRCLNEKTIISREMDYTLQSTGENKYMAVKYAFAPPNRVIVHTEDITERKQAEEALFTNEARLHLLVDQADFNLWSIDNNLKFTQSIGGGLEALGLKPNEIVGLDLYQYFQTDSSEFPAIKAHLQALIGSHINFETEWQGRYFQTHLSPQNDSQGNVIGCIGVAIDITERKQAENEKEHLQRELQQSQKMEALGKLTGGIAHEYNNMLAITIGFAALLEKALIGQPKLSKYAHEIIHAGNRGAKLTSKLLTFSRQNTSEATSLNLNTLLQMQQHMLEKSLTVRISLVFKLQENPWLVWLDSGDMEDVILNMSINAMHAIEGNGQLTIQTRNQQINQMDAESLNIAPGDYVLLSFTDTGCGMDKETKERIFDPFFTTKDELGTGLGLSMAYGFVQNSGGSINVYSEQGEGTQFTFYFPRYYGASRDQQLENKNNPEEAFIDNKTILVVDDEPTLLDLSREILTSHGFNVICAERAKDALNILEHESIDILLSDIIMPEMDGYQLAAIVKEKYPDIKIQLASGFTDDRNMDIVDESLRHNLLQKPFKLQALLQRIRELSDEN